MGKRTTDLAGLARVLQETVDKATEEEKAKVDIALRATVIDRYSAVIRSTPRDEGRAAGNWFLTNANPSVTYNVNGNDQQRLQELTTRTKGGMLGKRWFFTNNVPYIRVLEFGLYPKNPKKGTYNKQSKKYEIRSSGGFSKQAPKGMVRTNLLRFGSTFRKFLRRA